MKSLVLSTLIFFNAFLFRVESIPVTSVPNLFTDTELESFQKNLDTLLTPWKTSSKTKRKFVGTELKQIDLIITYNPLNFNFIKLDFDVNNQLTSKSLNDLKKKLSVEFSSFKSDKKKWKEATFDLFVTAIERLAKYSKLEGEHYIRTGIRGFFVYLDKTMEGALLTHNLGWHWDYCSHSTMVTELYSEFDPAGILFARNVNPSPLPVCIKPASHDDAIPDEETLIAVDHTKNGGLYFSCERGGIVHVPIPPQTPQDKHGLMMRVVLQVVLMDHEWLEMCKKDSAL